MKQTHRRRWRRLLQGLCLYGLLCGFFWAYLTVQTRSQNRMTHTPAAMAQLTIQPNQTASLCLAAQEYRWKLPRLDSQYSYQEPSLGRFSQLGNDHRHLVLQDI